MGGTENFARDLMYFLNEQKTRQNYKNAFFQNGNTGYFPQDFKCFRKANKSTKTQPQSM